MMATGCSFAGHINMDTTETPAPASAARSVPLISPCRMEGGVPVELKMTLQKSQSTHRDPMQSVARMKTGSLDIVEVVVGTLCTKSLRPKSK